MVYTIPPWRRGLTAQTRVKILQAKMSNKQFWKEVPWSKRLNRVLAGSLHWSKGKKRHIENVIRGWRGLEPEVASSEDETESSDSQDVRGTESEASWNEFVR